MTEVTRADFDAVMTPNYAPADMVLVRGSGSKVWDQQGNEYIDFAGGIAVNGLGHAAPELVEALTDQAHRLWHVSNAYATEPSIRLAKQLVAATFAEKVFFANSGGEANEAALKLARRYAVDNYGPEKAEIISFEQGFHGRTFFTVTVGGQAKYSDGFGPKPGMVTHLPFNDLDALGDALSDRVCAIMVEPVQGEGGLVAGDALFIRRLRDLCDEHNALLIFDEIQSGMGRTGELFAYMGYDVTPDILTTAKALGGGIPIGAMLTTAEVGASLVVGTHGSTFGGNPLATAVASRALEIINQPGFLAEVKRKAARLFAGLEELNRSRKLFSEIRGRGLWAGCVLAPEYAGHSKSVVDAALNEGLMGLRAGPDIVRFAPALNIPDEDLDEGLRRFGRALETVRFED
ncbi:MAG: acetylornithine/succinyldiaminopimelate transaminase [Acidimicrobiia bacterium]|nr:acetylornithine/succinyldiaminopimelate transaminase [Acidimicrobiia bacterium]